MLFERARDNAVCKIVRQCYGAQRFSEDLDFVCGRELDVKQLSGMKEVIERYLGVGA